MALNCDRNTPEMNGEYILMPVAANTVIYAGALVAANTDGYAIPGMVATDIKALGRAERQAVNNPGNAGDNQVLIKRGVFKFKNSTVDPVDKTNIYEDCFIVDDQTVAKTHGTNTRSRAGKVLIVVDDGVWVEIR